MVKSKVCLFYGRGDLGTPSKLNGRRFNRAVASSNRGRVRGNSISNALAVHIGRRARVEHGFPPGLARGTTEGPGGGRSAGRCFPRLVQPAARGDRRCLAHVARTVLPQSRSFTRAVSGCALRLGYSHARGGSLRLGALRPGGWTRLV